jgi:mono/diheme cytochrome c family protein
MKWFTELFLAWIGLFVIASHLLAGPVNPASPVTTTPPVYVPSTSHANGPLPDGVLVWDELMKTTDATNGQAFARFYFSFTNVASILQTGLATNVTVTTNVTTVIKRHFWGKRITHVNEVVTSTNIVAFTNAQPVPVTILSVHPSCGCTTAELPPVPWTIPPGTNGEINISVNLAGKSGTLFKTVNIATDWGSKTLTLRINIQPPPVRSPMTEAERARGLAAAKVDRQAVFRNDCATCHAQPAAGKYGKALFDAVCAVCHEAEHRATMVPDLHTLKTPTNEDFWRTWITHGKPGSLMPAFSSTEGGPLNDMQIASLAAYLNAAFPSRVPPPPQ